MVVKCEDVWREISNYFEADLDPALKRAMEEHFAQCRPLQRRARWHAQCHCALRRRKQCSPCLWASTRGCTTGSPIKSKGQRVSRRGWLVSVGVTGALAASAFCAAALDRFVPRPLSEMSQPARRLPERLVAVVDGGKTFHVPGCPFMHGKYRMVTPEEAIREGYAPCTRCMCDALRSAGNVTPDFEGEESASSATVEE